MEWREEGIVLGVRRQGETSAVAEIMTRDRGGISGSCAAGARASFSRFSSQAIRSRRHGARGWTSIWVS